MGKRSLTGKFAIGIFVLGMLFSLGVTGVWAGNTSTGSNVRGTIPYVACADITPHKAVKVDPKVLDDTIKTLENYIYVGDDGLFHFWKNIREICRWYGIDPVVSDALIKSLQVTNDKITKGELFLEEVSFSNNRNVFGDEVAPPHDEDYQAPLLESECKGSNKFKWCWWGVKRWADHCRSEDIAYTFIQISNGAAGCAAITVFFSQAEIALFCALATAYFRSFGADIKHSNHHRGTIISFTYLYAYSVKPQ